MDQRDEYEPIIAPKRRREPPRDDTQPLWRTVLALCAGLAVVAFLAWWFMGRSSNDASLTRTQGAASEFGPEIEVEQEVVPQARDEEPRAEATPRTEAPAPQPEPTQSESAATDEPVPESTTSEPTVSEPSAEEPASGVEQAATPDVPEVVPDAESQAAAPVSASPVSVRLKSPDSQVQIELRSLSDASTTLKGGVGDVVDVAPGAYRVVASGAGLEPIEQEVVFDRAGSSVEYIVELCAERKYERESLAGQVVEERACASTAECESLFMVLSEYAEQLVKDRNFRVQQCAKWRAAAAPEGTWTLDTKCEGATTFCRIEIAEGTCALAGPRRSLRGSACPRAELVGAGP